MKGLQSVTLVREMTLSINPLHIQVSVQNLKASFPVTTSSDILLCRPLVIDIRILKFSLVCRHLESERCIVFVCHS